MSSLRNRVVADRRMIDAVRARYAGPGDVLDLLWWSEHPGIPTPAGVPDPAVAIERDRQALYRPGAQGDPEAVVRREEAHREALAGAVAAATAVTRTEPTGEQESAAAPPAPRPRSGRPWVAAAAAAGVAVGLVAGALLAGPAGAPAPTPSATRALAVFQRTQNPRVDLPLERSRLPALLDAGSVRLLHSFSSIGTLFYGARTADRRVCVFVVVLAVPGAPACTTEAGFSAGGLTLLVRASADPVDDSGYRPQEELDLVWYPNGAVAITPTQLTSRRSSPTHAPSGS